jgi:hypothetical protein
MRPTRTRDLTRALAFSTVVGLALSACGTPSQDQTTSASEGPVVLGHVHGLGTNPADDRLYVASHTGVFKQTDTGFVRVAGRWQDTMAFTVTGGDTFLASGHPDLRQTDKPAHLGLVETTDAAQTWESVSLEGEADFHALEPAADRLYGYDSANGVLKVTTDRRSWRDIARTSAIDFPVDPGDPGNLLVTDERGRLLRLSPDQQKPRPVAGAPSLAFIDWPTSDLLVGVAPDGAVFRSQDGGASWESVNSVGSTPEALDITPGRWNVATERGLLSSADDGQTWTALSGQLGQTRG